MLSYLIIFENNSIPNVCWQDGDRLFKPFKSCRLIVIYSSTLIDKLIDYSRKSGHIRGQPSHYLVPYPSGPAFGIGMPALCVPRLRLLVWGYRVGCIDQDGWSICGRSFLQVLRLLRANLRNNQGNNQIFRVRRTETFLKKSGRIGCSESTHLNSGSVK